MKDIEELSVQRTTKVMAKRDRDSLPFRDRDDFLKRDFIKHYVKEAGWSEWLAEEHWREQRQSGRIYPKNGRFTTRYLQQRKADRLWAEQNAKRTGK
jgi:hypothetical protein